MRVREADREGKIYIERALIFKPGLFLFFFYLFFFLNIFFPFVLITNVQTNKNKLMNK